MLARYSFAVSQLVLIVFLMTGCSTPRYVAVSHGELEDIVKSREYFPYIRYVIVPSLQTSLTTEETAESANDSLLAKTKAYIKKKDYGALQKYLDGRADRDSGDVRFCRALLHFFKREYEIAQEILSSIADGEYTCTRALLLADCKYELEYLSGGMSLQDLLSMYQRAIDCSTDQLWKDLINIRVKYGRYKN